MQFGDVSGGLVDVPHLQQPAEGVQPIGVFVALGPERIGQRAGGLQVAPDLVQVTLVLQGEHHPEVGSGPIHR